MSACPLDIDFAVSKAQHPVLPKHSIVESWRMSSLSPDWLIFGQPIILTDCPSCVRAKPAILKCSDPDDVSTQLSLCSFQVLVQPATYWLNSPSIAVALPQSASVGVDPSGGAERTGDRPNRPAVHFIESNRTISRSAPPCA